MSNRKTKRLVSPELLDQPPPHDLNAERALLGALLADLSQLEEVAFLAPDDFYVEDHGRIFDHLRYLPHDGDAPADVTLLLSWLKGQKEVDRIGPLIGELFNHHPLASNVAHYGRIVKRLADKRRLSLLAGELLRAAHNGEHDPAAIVADFVARLEGIGASGEERFRLLSMAELDSRDFSADYVVEDVLAVGELCVIGGMYKTLKSSIALDLLLSITSGMHFLGQFRVLRRVHAVYFLGEGHGCFAQGVGRRVAQQKGITLAEVEGAYLCTDLPNLDNGGDLHEVGRVIKRHRAEFAFFDPLYLALGDSGESASNVFVIGQRLAAVQRACRAAGATPIIVHHLRKGRVEIAPATFGDLAQAGAAEFAGQWLLLNRTRPHDEADPGVHDLRLSVGSRLGHSSAWGLRIEEGTPRGLCGRFWRPQVTPWVDAVKADREATETRKRAREAQIMEGDRQAIIDVLARVGRDSRNSIRSEAGLGNGQRFERARAAVVRDGTVIRDGELRKGNKQMYDAYTLGNEGQE